MIVYEAIVLAHTRHGEVKCSTLGWSYKESDMLSSAAFAVVPVPILLFVALITLIFGTDHPNGKWSDRHKVPVPLPSGDGKCETPQMNDDLEASSVKEKSKSDGAEKTASVDVEEVIPHGGTAYYTFLDQFANFATQNQRPLFQTLNYCHGSLRLISF